MKVSTLYFGELEYNEQAIFRFTQGMPGLDEHFQFLLLPLEEGIPFSYLQSVEVGHLSILITNPFHFISNYDFSISESIQMELQIEDASEVEVWASVTVSEDLSAATTNLLAPIIVNSKKRLMKQIILHDSGYGIKHPLILESTDKIEKEG